MMTRLKLIPLSMLTIAISACSPQPSEQTDKPIVQASQNVVQTESEKLAQYFADMFEQDLKRSPITQSYLGYKWDYDKWNDISDAHQDETIAIQKARLVALQKFDTSQLTEQEKLSIDVAITDIQRRLANDKFRDHTYIMHQFRAYHTIVPSFLINIHRIKSIDDAEAYVARLNNVKPLFTQVIQQMKKRQELGVFPPKWAYDQMIQASHNVISGNPFEESPENSTIWDDFTTKVDALGLTNMETVGLIAEAREAIEESVLPAYRELIDELKIQQRLTPEGDGVWRLPDGEKWYKNRLEWFTTTDLNAEQVHQIGLENVERIHNAMKVIKQKVGFEGDLAAFFEFMRTDEQFYYPATDEGRARYMEEAKALIDTMEEKVPEYFGLTPKARMQVKRVEAFREKSAGKAFYQSPSKDGSRPGTYYANLYNMKDMPTYQMEALAYHEGIPGHH
ncbi:MAG: DUF885 domain-containing protein, partial [Paraglaciecola sp.]